MIEFTITPLYLFVFIAIASGTSLACPQGYYGPFCQACPLHTTTTSELSSISSTIHDCKCQAGFLCIYYKQLHATVTLNTTLSAFENNTGSVRTAFVSGVAAAAGVAPDQVHIHFTVIHLDHRRRFVLPHPDETIQVSVSVLGACSLQRVPQCLEGLHISHSWEIRRRLYVLKVPTKKHEIAEDQNT